VVARVVEAELGVVQLLREEPRGEAPLVVIAALAVLVARDEPERAAEIRNAAEAEPHLAAPARREVGRLSMERLVRREREKPELAGLSPALQPSVNSGKAFARRAPVVG